ncbi:MAG TPA: tetratricopeptide repeat protein, partial [Candidatus Ozemobacteraceae bacterium]|nr:tetratricopeptide repeat protein [Candidatus Ozemobacteraceae bacterium]
WFALDACLAQLRLLARLGEAYGRLGRWDEAFRELAEAAATASSAELLYNLALAAGRTGRVGEATKALERSLACDAGFRPAVELRKVMDRALTGAPGLE